MSYVLKRLMVNKLLEICLGLVGANYSDHTTKNLKNNLLRKFYLGGWEDSVLAEGEGQQI